MQLPLILCILINLPISLTYTEFGYAPNECSDELINQSRLERACTKQTIDITEFKNAVYSTLVQYSGDNGTVHALSDKYCPSVRQYLQCTRITRKECSSPTSHARKNQTIVLYGALLDYVCTNRSGVLVHLLQNHGLETIYENKKFDRCITYMNVPRINKLTLGPTVELCKGMAKSVECYTDLVREHQNQDLIGIANQVDIVIREAFKCKSANDL